MTHLLLDELLQDRTKLADLVGKMGLLKQPTQALVECCLETEMEVHLGSVLHLVMILITRLNQTRNG